MGNQDAALGKVVRNFTLVENILRDIGSFIDTLVPLEDEDVFKEVISNMYFKVASLESSVEQFKNDLSSYILADSKPTQSGDEE